jgi:serine/threonine protein kinase
MTSFLSHHNMAEKKASSWSEQEFFGLEITGVEETGKELGRGAYGVVQEAVWWGTKCVTKRLHNILSVEAQSKHSKDFLTECFTWSRLRHPHIVQFLGLLFEKDSPLPVLVLEKLSTSLRRHLERSSRSEFLLRDKVTVLHHVILGLAYLHSLKHIHRDLTTNNILIDILNWHAKISDFGVTRVLADERIKQTTSTIVPGAEAFMAPEAFELLSQFSCEFDVFSYGCVMVSTVSHCWPQPSAAKKKINGKLVALTELERRETYIDQFTSEEKELFAGVIERCLEEEAKDRPTSLSLVEEISHLRSSFEQVDTLEEKYEEAMAMNKKLEEELEGVHGEIEKARTELEELRESSKLLERGKEELVEAQEEFTAVSSSCHHL